MAQEDELPESEGANKLQERMAVYIQKRLGLTKAEAQKFSPIFLRYIVELRKTHRENKTDRPMLQLKVAELRIRFRNEFKQIMDEHRANKIYDYQREFELKVIDEIKQRRLENRTAPRRQRSVVDGF
jgi:hypothetical protein